MKEIINLSYLARKWGGNLVQLSDFDRKWGAEFYLSPFQDYLGFNWKRKKVYFKDEQDWPVIIHEMGHVFASKKPPQKQDEFEFFGWEYCLARIIGGNISKWYKYNEDYCIGTHYFHNKDLFSDLNIKERRIVLNERIQAGQELGIIDDKRRPIAIR